VYSGYNHRGCDTVTLLLDTNILVVYVASN